jgi:hypothetical protein
MVRYFPLVLTDPVQIGLVAQCPVGVGAVIDWLHLDLTRRVLNNMRAGI